MTELKDLHEAVWHGCLVRDRLADKGIHIDTPDFDIFLEAKVKRAFGTIEPTVRKSWRELIEAHGEPREFDFFDRDLFCAFVETNCWLQDITYLVSDTFEEEVCASFCLMWGYLYDRFGSSMMDVIGSLDADEAEQFYDDEILQK